MRINIEEKILVPERVEAKVENNILTIKGPKGENKRRFGHSEIKIEVKGKEIIIKSIGATKREKTMLFTYIAHIKNLIKGVAEGFTYKLKICAGHFPMNVSVANDILSVKNFLGEKVPRTVKINPEVKVKIEGSLIIIEGVNKELVGQTAGSIEQLTRITNRDLRIFQDGIYITEKAGKDMAR